MDIYIRTGIGQVAQKRATTYRMDGQYNRLVWCINTRTIPRCFGETKMASNNENGIGHLRALVPWLMMMMMNSLLCSRTLFYLLLFLSICGIWTTLNKRD